MKHGSLFAGIEGFGLGFRQAGFRTVWAVEKEPFCQAIIRTHFQGTEIHSDVHDVGKHNLAAVDVLTAGFPCQDLSVAGKRAGLGGARSGLFWQAHRIIGELQPPWFVIENVPGLFSSNSGRDFAVLLRGLDELGYGLAWRVLDSQFFGVAQRRRRVFIVGCLGRPCPQEVLFESAGSEGDFAESGEARTGVTEEAPRRITPTIHAGLGYHGWACGDQDFGLLQAHAISASNGHHGHSSPRGDGSDNLIAHPITASYGKQVDSSDRNGGPPNLVTAFGFSAGQSAKAGSLGLREEQSPTLRGASSGTNQVPAVGTTNNVSTPPDSDRMRSFTELPEGLDSARYRALGNAVTANVAQWIAERIKAQIETETPVNKELGN